MEDIVLTFRFQRRGTTTVIPLNYYASTTDAIRRLLVEYYAICFLLEDIPMMDSLSYGSEVLRRIVCWLHQQDKGQEGFVTPHGRQVHHGMSIISDLYLMALSFPWGYKRSGDYKT